MKRIINTRVWEGTLSQLTASQKVFRKGDIIIVSDDPTRHKVADGQGAFDDLPWVNGPGRNHTAVAINATATATGDQLKGGLITSTSAAAMAITLPSAAALLTATGLSGKASFDLIVDNSAGANTVTITPSASITAATAVVTGGATLTVGAGAVGLFRIYFSSGTVAKIYRIG